MVIARSTYAEEACTLWLPFLSDLLIIIYYHGNTPVKSVLGQQCAEIIPLLEQRSQVYDVKNKATRLHMECTQARREATIVSTSL